MKTGVYVNRSLNMTRIKCIGFDMDHTLVCYKSRNFEKLVHEIICNILVTNKGYPEQVQSFKIDFDRAIRGLVIDKARGNLLKLSRHAAIKVSYHGRRLIPTEVQRDIYEGTYIDLKDPDYITVDTAFSVAFTSLFAQLVDFKDADPKARFPTYKDLAADLTEALDEVHRKGFLKSRVRENLSHFIIQDPEVALGLERLKKHDKKIFLLTNSDYFYTKALLDYTLTPFLQNHSCWEDLFDFVITSANKPRFFYDKLSFFKIDSKTGGMYHIEDKLKSGIYYGGCADTFTKQLNLMPNDILYIGDHIYGDVVLLKKECAWRTALIVEEIADEIKKLKETKELTEKINQIVQEKITLENEIEKLVSAHIEDQKKAGEVEEINKKIRRADFLEKEIKQNSQVLRTHFNIYWGEVMKAESEDSYFAYQVERYACIYMAKIRDFLRHSPRTFYRAEHRPLAHERKHK